MSTDRQPLKLPIGINDFETMRTEGYLYVDKTREIHRMVTLGKFYFLSRPRRFGKSVLVTTLKCVFQGRKDLFDDLWIAKQNDWNWQEHPVIMLDFTGISNDTPEHLQQGLETSLMRIAGGYDVQLTSPLLMSKFTELILALSKKIGRPVAVLIDEYDKPIIDHLGKGTQELEIAKANRDVLKRFFGVLKDITIAPNLRFVFLTGISRFSKVSIFSELNNLDDISMSDAYAGLLGYTQEELEREFAHNIQAFAEQLGWTEEQVVAKLKDYYNGYRFADCDLHVYNPFSILKALNTRKFKPYWFETGTPSFLVRLLRRARYDFAEIENLVMDQSMTTYDLDDLKPEVLLFQTGYVAIKEVQEEWYVLDYPNQEVKQAFLKHLLFSEEPAINGSVRSDVLRLTSYLQQEHFDAFFEAMTAIFASIPYDIEPKRDEAYFHTLFYLMLTASGADARSSVLTCKGRIDLAVFFPDTTYIIEFKCNQSADAAIRQIQDNSYADQYRSSGKQITLVGINFSTEHKNLAEWKIVKCDSGITPPQ